MTREPAIVAHGWGFRYHGRDRTSLRGIDLEVPAGQRVLLLGASGAGKSTLLRALAGLTEQAGEPAGDLRVLGRPPHAGDGSCGYVAQDPATALVMARAGDDVAFGLENIGVAPVLIGERVRHALTAVGLTGFEQRKTAQLSGGEQQRLVLAGVTALAPPVLLLDEPTALLDPDGAAEVRGAVRRLLADRATTLVLIEHRVADWLDLLDRVVVLDRAGGMAADGSPTEVFGSEAKVLDELGVWAPGKVTARLRRRGGRGADAEAEPVVVGRGLRLRYPDSPVDAVAGVGAVLRPGRVLALTGPNGSGKSSLGRMLAGLVSPSAGSVHAAPPRVRAGRRARAGAPLHRWRSDDLARTVGMVFQNPEHQVLTTTVAGELAVGARVAGVDPAARRRRVEELLQRLRLEHLATTDPFTLSGGEQRRLSVATALAAAPRAVVLDEPTYGQDRRTWTELVALLDEVRADGVALCCISHDPDLVAALADETLRLDRGTPRGAPR